jgi:Ala-tRNA(Pro) deacylase
MPATRQDLFARLDGLGIATRTVEHAPVFTVDEARRLRGEIPGGHTKNLFLIDKDERLWLVVALEDAAVDLKALPHKVGSGRVSFGKPDRLRQALGIEPGSVTPFALINDVDNRVNVVLDEAMMREPLLNCHPLENTATTTIAAAELLRFIRSCGHSPKIVAVS